MCYISKLQAAVCIIFCLFVGNGTYGLAAVVPLVPQWTYWSQDGTDYRSFNGGTMTININTLETTLSTEPQASYPANQNFTASVDFSNFSTQGEITNTSAGTHSDVHMAINWDIGEIDGLAARSEIAVRRTSRNDGNEEFGACYSTYDGKTSENHQCFSETGSDSSGKFAISKNGADVTVSVKDINGALLHTWTFNSIETDNHDIKVRLAASNGSRERTSVDFSNLDMDPVPIDINWFSIQRRYKEEVREFNRCTFSAVDTSGNYVASEIFSSVQVFYPSGNIIALGPQSFSGVYDNLSGRYDATNGKWVYNSFSPESYFNWNFAGDLPVGQYHLVATTNDGITYHKYLNYSGIATLPVISSTSFYAYKDEDGNLFFSWEVPYISSFTSSGLNTQVRAWVDVYEGNVYKASVFVSVPTHMGHVFIPKNIVQLYESKGSDYQIGVHIRTTDNSTRNYSSNVPLVLAGGPPVIGDVNGDGNVGLVEAINALKVASGVQ